MKSLVIHIQRTKSPPAGCNPSGLSRQCSMKMSTGWSTSQWLQQVQPLTFILHQRRPLTILSSLFLEFNPFNTRSLKLASIVQHFKFPNAISSQNKLYDYYHHYYWHRSGHYRSSCDVFQFRERWWALQGFSTERFQFIGPFQNNEIEQESSKWAIYWDWVRNTLFSIRPSRKWQPLFLGVP